MKKFTWYDLKRMEVDMFFVVVMMIFFWIGYIAGMGNYISAISLEPASSSTSQKLDSALKNLGEIKKDGRYIDSAGTLPIIIRIREKTPLSMAKASLAPLLKPTDNYSSPVDLKIIHSIAARVNIGSLDELAQSSYVEKIRLDEIIHADIDESTALINADDVWQAEDENGLSIKGKGVTIAIIDSGVDYTHEDLGGCLAPFILGGCAKVTKGKDFVMNDNDPMDDYGHGTHVASTAAGTGAASNGKFAGVAPEAEIWAAKVLDSTGSGPVSRVILGIEWATDPNGDGDFSDRADIMNISISLITWDELTEAFNRGVLPVVSAGNNGLDGERTLNASSYSESALMVGATYKEEMRHRLCDDEPASYIDKLACFSSRGPTLLWDPDGADTVSLLSKPDISAPGVNICAARSISNSSGLGVGCGPKRVLMSGTSMATPVVAGAAALIKQQHPSWTPQEIKSALTLSAKDMGYKATHGGSGRLDVLKASQIPFVADKSSISFGVIPTGSREASLALTNKSSENMELSISVGDGTREDGVIKTVVMSQAPTISLSPGGSRTVIFRTVDVDPASRGLYEGFISITDRTNSYTVPYILRLGNDSTPKLIINHPRNYCVYPVVGQCLNNDTVSFPKKPTIVGLVQIEADVWPFPVEIDRVEFLINGVLRATSTEHGNYWWGWKPDSTEVGDNRITVRAIDVRGGVGEDFIDINVPLAP